MLLTHDSELRENMAVPEVQRDHCDRRKVGLWHVSRVGVKASFIDEKHPLLHNNKFFQPK